MDLFTNQDSEWDETSLPFEMDMTDTVFWERILVIIFKNILLIENDS